MHCGSPWQLKTPADPLPLQRCMEQPTCVKPPPCCRNKCSIATLSCFKDPGYETVPITLAESKSLMHLTRNGSLINVISFKKDAFRMNTEDENTFSCYIYNSLSFPGLFVLEVN